MISSNARLAIGASPFALAFAMFAGASPASAQAAAQQAPSSAPVVLPADDPAQDQGGALPNDIIVTGTSIRGVQPVGANLISVGPQDIAATGAQNLNQVLQTVPALTGMGNGGDPSHSQPQIHQLGGSASTTTLILIDGHRTAPGGTNHTNVDPSLIPINMIERIEVLPEGASSVYGSDAVAGVVNFITRTRYDGVQLGGQVGFRDGSHTWQATALAGKTWDTGSIIAGYAHIDADSLAAVDRPYTNPDHSARGGKNFSNFNCFPATLQPGGSGPIFLDATSGKAVANSSANAPCSGWAYGDLLPHHVRDSVMVKGRMDLTDRLKLGVDFVYSSNRTSGATSRGTLTATAFGTGAQANPFYLTPVGYSGTATKETVRWLADDMFGPGAKNLTGDDSYYADGTLEYDIDGNFAANLLVLAAHDDSYKKSVGTINQSVANLYLNGTTNSAGNPTLPSIPGYDGIITNLPLTPANALDVWRSGADNLTPESVREALLENDNLTRQVFTVNQVRLGTDGKLFSLPAGQVGIAFGGEYLRTRLYELLVAGNNAGSAQVGSNQRQLTFTRNVESLYGEIQIPVVGPDMHVPLMRSLQVNVSGRYDHYSDFGDTTNPKVAVDWELGAGFKLRGNVSTSFVAPPLDIVGDQYGVYVNSRFNSFTNNIDVPVALFPDLPKMGIPGCTAQSKTCNISSLQGLRVNTGDHNAGPQKGSGYSFGLDFHPDFLPALRGQVTFWHSRIKGAVTGPQIDFVVHTKSLAHLLTFYPGGATPEQIAAATAHIPQVSALPTVTGYILQVINSNYLNLDVDGIDANVSYAIETTGAGTFTIGDSLTYFTKFKQSYGDGTWYSVLNTTGSNGVFPSVQFQMRGNLGWQWGGLDANLFLNYTGAYRNWSGSATNPVTLDDNGNPTGGGDRVSPNLTIDANIAYTFSGGWLDGKQVSLNVRNLFDRKPPFYNTSSGYDDYVANVIGREITLGLRLKF